jgi:hypothetical protein
MIEATIDIPTADGPMDTLLCYPERGGPSPAVCVLMDTHGIREELRDMARRTSRARSGISRRRRGKSWGTMRRICVQGA